jgi:hypothetical protein
MALPSNIRDRFGEAGTLSATTPFVSGIPRSPARIVHQNGKLQPYRPLQIFGKLFENLARVTTPEELLSFIEKFGPLTKEGLNPSKGDEVHHVLDHAKQMQLLIDAYRMGKKAEIKNILGPKGRPLGDGPLGDVQATLVFDPITERPRLQFAPQNLLNAIWFQLGEYLGDEPNLMECQHCGATFERGPRGTRRDGAKFCTDAHKTDFHSRKRSKYELIPMREAE